jgi:uncharacterized membrane protein YccC
MCLSRRNIRDLDAKTRRIWAAGNLCLFTSLAFTLFGEGTRRNHLALVDGLRGFLIGLALVFLVWSTRRMLNPSARV